MISVPPTSLVIRAATFGSTLMLSLAMFGSLPKFKERRQRYFAEAATDGSVTRMRLLHLTGANVNANGASATPLLLAAGEGRLGAVRYLLGEGADVNASAPNGNTALTEATFYGHAQIAKELLVHGADANALSANGTALDIATNKHDPILVELLKHYGGKRANEVR
jgi:ankyrin repeat protein